MRLDVAKIMGDAGVTPRLVALYVPDYVLPSARIAKSSRMAQILQQMLPGYDISVPVASGPFEDAGGVSAYFDKDKGAMTPQRLVLSVKRDFLTSMATVLRAIKVHRPQILIADGQGVLIALGISKALLLETCLAVRNVQHQELPQLTKL